MQWSSLPPDLDPPASPSPLDLSVENAIKHHFDELNLLMSTTAEEGEGNVLAAVTFPKNSDAIACNGNAWRTLWLRMSFPTLAGLNSSKINAMFKPKRQERMRRHLGMETLPPGIDYVLDFTPPTEGSELADLTAALWLPKMVKLWFLAGHYCPEEILESGHLASIWDKRPLASRSVSAMLVLGHDDACRGLLQFCSMDRSEWKPKVVPGIVDVDPEDEEHSSYFPTFRRIPDYCGIRHRVAIMRVLHAINGNGLLLNSAARMWTVAQVAIHLEVPQVVVDPVTQWLIAPPNTKFVEICPERSFQLALALKIPSVLVAAFRILVSELAVDYAAPDPSPKRSALTWAQRRRDDYGDLPSDPVEYASRTFSERIIGLLEMLRSNTVFDRIGTGLEEWDLLKQQGMIIHEQGSNELKTAHENLIQALVGIFHNDIQRCLREHAPSGRLATLIAAQRSHYIPLHERYSLRDLYENLSHTQRALTPFFWESLYHQSLPKLSGNGPFSLSTYNGCTIRTYVDKYTSLWEAANLPHPDFQPNPEKGEYHSHHISKRLNEFNIHQFESEVYAALSSLCDRVLGKGYNEEPFQFFLSDHLLLPSLTSPEMDFLPIWAGGLDDGSGGVFQNAIPPAEMGPSEPGPAYHTGYTIPTTGTRTAGTGTRDGDGDDTTMMDDDDRIGGSIYGVSELGDNLDRFEIISARTAQTATETATVPSMDVEQSVVTTTTTTSSTGLGSGLGRLNLDPGGPNRHRVVAVPSETSSGDFHLNSREDGEYADAMYTQPAEHQAVGRALARYVDGNDGTTTGRSESGHASSSSKQGGMIAAGGRGAGGSNNNNGGGYSDTDNFMLEDDEDGGLKDLDGSDDGSLTVGADSDYDMV
ncbi:hypothetical protein NEUTE1DRAFT_128594 [Neurospora tetrasperma FGSC 2508]|uniref:Uncharacterized protein n=1 Tax=Neurospora tetrasperma (strain FGSC 2508 / ATCC MYA-4615 / P0657) TaxID=510951 RepID=F8MJE0_NEUT8|nr:uncharacterized protein NEUTE1DRAFT_128594 [Neurospora tetrasperma FGSC 2508]EGO59137.1 hypothetical protein NEUTE1DRAFT_128594 [Neurospora tetrasperma FGSC 2508]EGZ73247.1 hypothetical protein NEUTE2DRAFT_107586 [Neurospora tetrasperma FGSC 2509]